MEIANSFVKLIKGEDISHIIPKHTTAAVSVGNNDGASGIYVNKSFWGLQQKIETGGIDKVEKPSNESSIVDKVFDEADISMNH
ncbi:Hypothetical predicted protein [Olea europaea subsp. europaea]|uniref:Uncharacterized protein n=1 Tax=Olea europaea subsp. europaea TaxID=158383 RepID=A0A8S0RQU9_OLEEU|nr:Hypothetical predicted protein [Olea europaea subsp. europaea]